ncbi:MAG: ribonuclease H-like domain-containing protein [Candidatus Nanohaloarchaea archaeon]|nr:ribonuclease H-like domain-containing protein [Candidatus Nanohaloarchaea archaeon]
MLRNSFCFLDGVGETTEQRLWQQGITTWNDFIDTSSVRGIGDQRKQQHEQFLQKADKNLEKRNRAFFNHKVPDREHWRLYEEFKDSIAYLDIETTGLDQRRNKITTVSIYDGSDATTLVQGQDLNAEQLQQLLDRYELLVTFNGKQFDLPFLTHNLPDLELDHPHIDLMYDCKKLGLKGGLKAIEQELGIGRDDIDDIDGREAIRLWKKHQRGDEQALETLIEYNQKDVQNLAPLLQHTYTRLKDKKFKRHVANSH